MNSELSPAGTSIAATVLVVITSACCVGPLAAAFSFVGLSGTTMLAVENTLGPYRPFILTLTVVFLVVGFWSAYREGSCDNGKICAIPATRRLQRVLLWVATGLFAVLLYFTYVHPNLDLLFDIYL